MKRSTLITVFILSLLVFLLLCCLCLAVLLVGGAFYSWNLTLPAQTEFSWDAAPTATPVVVRPSPQATTPVDPTQEGGTEEPKHRRHAHRRAGSRPGDYQHADEY